jgi:hypothetical protein
MKTHRILRLVLHGLVGLVLIAAVGGILWTVFLATGVVSFLAILIISLWLVLFAGFKLWGVLTRRRTAATRKPTT